MKKNIIVFDFDGTLNKHFDGAVNPYQSNTRSWVKLLISKGYYVYIVTRRYGPENSALGAVDEHVQVLALAKELGVPEERVIFTNREWKYSTLEKLGACLHVDDDDREMYWIQRHLPGVKRIFLGNYDWDQELEKFVNKQNSTMIWLQNKKNRYTLAACVFISLLAILFAII